jgi:hypothetical protein
MGNCYPSSKPKGRYVSTGQNRILQLIAVQEEAVGRNVGHVTNCLFCILSEQPRNYACRRYQRWYHRRCLTPQNQQSAGE